jgi:putative ABC transport system permease protein
VTLGSLAVKNIRRNPLRTALTVVGVAIAILAFVFIRTILDSWATGAQHAAQDRLGTMHKVTFVMPLPRKYVDQVREVDGIKAVTYSNWFGGKHPTQENAFFANMAVDTDTFFEVYSDMAVPPDQMKKWKETPNGAIIGSALAKQFGWKLGDEVTLTGTIYPSDPEDPWKFEITGIYEPTRRAVDAAQFLFHWKWFNKKLEKRDPKAANEIGWIASTVDSPGRSAEVAQAIDALFESKDVQTRTMNERAMQTEFMGAFSAILTALDIVSIVILAIMMLILGNTIAMGVRERTNEYGVLLALGFRPKHIAGFVLGEGLTIGLLGGGVGLLLSYPIVEKGMGRFIEENMGAYFPYFRVPAEVALAALLMAAILAAVAAAIPAWRASRLDVIDALRRLG